MGVILVYVLLVLAIGGTASAQSTVWQGVYTDAQAARGQTEYTSHCANCHRDDLSGYNAILKGRRFMEKYRESSLYLLFDKTKTTMPRGAPATLSDKAYVDIVSYMLKANEFPVGAQELRFEDLTKIQLTGKDGPEEVPNGALVRAVGCLTSTDGVWMLARATEPVRTGNPQPATGEREEAVAFALGTQTYRLLVSAAYTPGPLTGHKVEVRGFLIRRPAELRVNISSLESLDPSCAE